MSVAARKGGDPLRRALVADDDPQVRAVTCRLLQGLGIEAAGVADGLDALVKLREQAYDLLVTDLDMPRLNGQSLVSALRAEGSQLPIMVISGVGDTQDVVELFDHSVGEYVRKPFRRREFEASVQRLIGGEAANDRREIEQRRPEATPRAPAVRETEPDTTQPPSPTAADASAPPPAHPSSLAEALEGLEGRLASGASVLPAPLPSMAKLVRMRRDPTISSQAIVNMVSASPTLAASAVRMANTAFYGRGSKVTNLSHAAIRLGNRALVDMAMTVLHEKFYRVRNAELQSIVDATWAGSLWTARLGRELAQSTYGVDADDIYLAALFHNVGDMVVLRAVDGHVSDQQLSARELATLRMECRRQHASLGSRLLEHWGFPESCARLALCHHTGSLPEDRGELKGSERRMLHVLNIALHFSQALAPRGSISHPPDLPLDQSLGVVEIPLARARGIAEHLFDKNPDDSRRSAADRA